MEFGSHRWMAVLLFALTAAPATGAPQGEDLRFWLENMIWYHHYTLDEMAQATGLPKPEIERATKDLDITRATRPKRNPQAPLLVLPYPGGRHPRIGFLDGAINPMRGTKFSVFLPWPDAGYVVVDLPEAIWANGELIFLAHTHIPTVWDKKGITLPDIDWTRKEGGRLESRRRLPDDVEFAMRVLPRREFVDMELSIENGSDKALTQIRSQNCVMLKGAPDFNGQTSENKVKIDEVVAVRSKDGRRWIATAWDSGRPWENPPVPCMHSDPNFPDCPPGKTVTARGRIFFYEGEDIRDEIQRLRKEKQLHWRPQ